MNTLDLTFIISFLGLVVCFLFIRNRNRYWARKKVPYIKPRNPILGNSLDILLNRDMFADYYGKMYDELAPHKFGGYFELLTPNLIIRDPEVVKKILTKDFHYFINRDNHFVDENDPLSLNISNLTGDRWKILRAKLTPTFTAGRIKIMFKLMNECTQDLIDVIDKAIVDDDFPEMKETMARFTTDIISSCIFGLKSDSLKNPDSIIRQIGKKPFEITIRVYLIGMLVFFFPQLKKKLGVSQFPPDVQRFFQRIVHENVSYREKNNEHRNDFLDLLIALRNETKNQGNEFELTDDMMVAQCFIFFVGGVETTAGTSTFALYELAKHKDIQARLYDEVKAVLKQHNNDLTYDSIQQMTYLGQVVNETLRLHTIAPLLVRVCTEDYHLEEDIVIEKGTRVIIPTFAIQTDPQYYDSPMEYNPENFSKEAKDQRHHYTNLPFGEGPRMCIGMRLALLQVKLAVVTVIRNYEVSLSSTMKEPLQLDKKSVFFPVVKGGVHLVFKKRTQKQI